MEEEGEEWQRDDDGEQEEVGHGRGGRETEEVSSLSLRLPQRYSTLLPSLYSHPSLVLIFLPSFL